MRSLALCFFMLLAAVPAFAQYGNSYSCEVLMVDRYNRVIDRFYAQRDYQTNRCRDGLRDCNKELRVRGVSGATCVESTNTPPRPNPNPNPYPNPSQNISYLLSLSNARLAQEAMFGIGRCKVDQGNYSSACQLYVKVNGYGYPSGSGCAQQQYTQYYGCSSYSEQENAGCMVRQALQRGQCL
jgi:hypothetical protein